MNLLNLNKTRNTRNISSNIAAFSDFIDFSKSFTIVTSCFALKVSYVRRNEGGLQEGNLTMIKVNPQSIPVL